MVADTPERRLARAMNGFIRRLPRDAQDAQPRLSADPFRARASWDREVIPSFGNIRYRWDPTVRWDRYSFSPISRLLRPAAASWAIWSS